MFENIFQHYNNNNFLKNILFSMNLKELFMDHSDCYLNIKWNQLNKLYYEKNVNIDYYENNKNIFGIHWFNGADASKDYCNNLNLDLLKNTNSNSCSLIDKLVKKYI